MSASRPHFRVAGIPVRIEPVFWLVTAFLAFNLEDARLIIVWVAVVLVSILVHELGHAIALKAFGQPSAIVLHGFGGMTLSNRRTSRTQSILVSLAGPLSAMALLGIPAYLIRESDVGQELAWDYALGDGGFGWWPVVYFAVYVNIWWSVANLLPIRPLDGGNVMTELIGLQRARLLSIAFGAAAAIWAYFFAAPGLEYAAFFAAILAFINFSEHRRAKMGAAAPSAFDIDGPDPGARGTTRHPATRPRTTGGRPTGPPTSPASGPVRDVHELAGAVDPEAAERFAWNLVRRGDAAAARRVLARATGPVGPFVVPTVELAAGGSLDGLAAAYLANPGGPSNLVPATVAADRGQSVTLAHWLVSHDGPAGREAAGSLQTHLHYAERFDHAAAVGEVLHGARPSAPAQVAFDTACAWSRAGDPDRGLTWVDRAVDDGFSAARVLDGEPDLAAVRALPGWAAVRARLA